VPQAGVVDLKFVPSARARKILAKHHKLPVTITLTATPTGGQPITQTLSETLKGKR
jgi:hypothetical protein